METGGGEPQKRLAKTKKLMMSADYSNTIDRQIDRIPYQHPKTDGNGRRRASEKTRENERYRNVLKVWRMGRKEGRNTGLSSKTEGWAVSTPNFSPNTRWNRVSLEKLLARSIKFTCVLYIPLHLGNPVWKPRKAPLRPRPQKSSEISSRIFIRSRK